MIWDFIWDLDARYGTFKSPQKKTPHRRSVHAGIKVEPMGIEPTTSRVRLQSHGGKHGVSP